MDASRSTITAVSSAPISGLGRPIVWSVASNRFAVLGSAAGAILIAVLRAAAHRPVTIGNLSAGFIALFLAWAIGREIDPDEPATAGVAVLLALLGVLQFGFSSLWIVVGILVSVRLIVGTVGLTLRWWDVGIIAVLAAYLGYREASWVLVVALAVGAAAAGGRYGSAAGLGVAAVGFAGLAFSAASAGFVLPGPATGVVLIGVAASAVIVAGSPAPTSVTDIGSTSLRRERLVAGQIAVAVIVVIVALQQGFVTPVAPAAAALLAAAVLQLRRTWRRLRAEPA